MTRPPLPRRAPHRFDALGRVSEAAGAVFTVLLVSALVALPACKGGETAVPAPGTPSPATTPATPTPPATSSRPTAALDLAPVPPPPDLAKTVAATDPPATPPAAPSAPATTAGTGQSLASVHAQLDALLGKASRCTADADCRSVAVGGKACGGPTGYRAYSTTGADPAEVEALAKREHDLALEEARASHRVSNCMMLADPGARCTQNRCVTGGPNPASPNAR